MNKEKSESWFMSIISYRACLNILFYFVINFLVSFIYVYVFNFYHLKKYQSAFNINSRYLSKEINRIWVHFITRIFDNKSSLNKTIK